ncbi:hypothetical protein QQY24_02330 [Streptomyces sp. TG1A-8]|uniref:hypothetical protein n=1 Tax=Streptomyces sp. TG1A-8 TaxID=3051385 RepID=UPI00265B8D69|nr:hypothetical protein [Streptomyces sp. TG1A-8]MDO0924302.1 hypothetical protein [Streptomyces sp. TG1A-8]
MAVPSPTAAARHRPRSVRACPVLVCLYLTAAVTGLALGGWPQRLLAPVLLAAAVHHVAAHRATARRRTVRTAEQYGPPAGRAGRRPGRRAGRGRGSGAGRGRGSGAGRGRGSGAGREPGSEGSRP